MRDSTVIKMMTMWRRRSLSKNKRKRKFKSRFKPSLKMIRAGQ